LPPAQLSEAGKSIPLGKAPTDRRDCCVNTL